MEFLTIVNILVVVINIGVFFATLKLYTEYFKDRSITKRT